MNNNTQNQYSKKIVSISKLKKIIKNYPRKEKVILCHGNFDVVHPGHVRHLTYAKSKADILVVSITADRYVQKGIYKPFVPEDLVTQLKIGGKMVAPIGVGDIQVMHLIEKISETETKTTTHGKFSFVPMLNDKNNGN